DMTDNIIFVFHISSFRQEQSSTENRCHSIGCPRDRFRNRHSPDGLGNHVRENMRAVNYAQSLTRPCRPPRHPGIKPLGREHLELWIRCPYRVFFPVTPHWDVKSSTGADPIAQIIFSKQKA